MKPIRTALTIAAVLLACVDGASIRADTPAASAPEAGHAVRIYATGGGARVLHDVAEVIEARLGCVITYEDPRYSPNMMTSLGVGGPVVSRRTRVVFDIAAAPNADALAMVQSLVEPFARDSGIAMTVARSKRAPQMLHIQPAHSLFSGDITLDASGTYEECAKRICASASARGPARITFFNTANDNFQREQASVSATRRSAIDALDDLIGAFNRSNGPFKANHPLDRVSWRINRDLSEPSPMILENVPSQGAGREDVCLRLESDRPLAEAVQLASHELRLTCVYEDPAWSCELMYDKAGKPSGLLGARVECSLTRTDNPVLSMERIVQSFNDHSANTLFQAITSAGVSYIAPQPADRQGNAASGAPLLQREVALRVVNRPVRAVLRDIARSLSRLAGKPVTLGTLALLPDTAVTLAHDPAPLYRQLAELSKQLGTPMTWLLLYDPATRSYKLDAVCDQHDDAAFFSQITDQ